MPSGKQASGLRCCRMALAIRGLVNSILGLVEKTSSGGGEMKSGARSAGKRRRRIERKMRVPMRPTERRSLPAPRACAELFFILVSQLLSRSVHEIVAAGLLTFPNSCSLPVPFVFGTVALLQKPFHLPRGMQDYSSGYCPGFTPGSLLRLRCFHVQAPQVKVCRIRKSFLPPNRRKQDMP